MIVLESLSKGIKDTGYDVASLSRTPSLSTAVLSEVISLSTHKSAYLSEVDLERLGRGIKPKGSWKI
jgi:hypothetical protein